MISYDKILFPIDLTQGSVEIVAHVAKLTEQFNAEAHVVYVAKTSEYYREDECETGQRKCEPGQIITRTVVEFVKNNCAILKSPQIVVLDGDPQEEILAYIVNQKIKLVIMAHSSKSALGKAVFGSVAGSVVRNSRVPVFLVPPEGGKVFC